MAKYQYVKKKLNVPLLIVLLCCAFVPGIIYLIWVNIPRKVLLDAPKSNGWILRLVGTAIIPLNWLVWKLMLDADDFPTIFYLGLALGVAALIPAIFSKKSFDLYWSSENFLKCFIVVNIFEYLSTFLRVLSLFCKMLCKVLF